MENSWIFYALGSAIFAAAINVLAKFGMKDVDKDFATAVRSVVQAIVVVGFASVVGVMKNFGQLHAKAMMSITATGICGALFLDLRLPRTPDRRRQQGRADR